MERLVEFQLVQGGSTLVEVDEPPGGPVMRRIGKDRSTLAEKTDETFEDATAAVTPAARSLIARLRSIDDAPDEVEIEFGDAVECADRSVHRVGGRRSKFQDVYDLAAPRCRR